MKNRDIGISGHLQNCKIVKIAGIESQNQRLTTETRRHGVAEPQPNPRITTERTEKEPEDTEESQELQQANKKR
jgi:hypothetical protein